MNSIFLSFYLNDSEQNKVFIETLRNLNESGVPYIVRQDKLLVELEITNGY